MDRQRSGSGEKPDKSPPWLGLPVPSGAGWMIAGYGMGNNCKRRPREKDKQQHARQHGSTTWNERPPSEFPTKTPCLGGGEEACGVHTDSISFTRSSIWWADAFLTGCTTQPSNIGVLGPRRSQRKWFLQLASHCSQTAHHLVPYHRHSTVLHCCANMERLSSLLQASSVD